MVGGRRPIARRSLATCCDLPTLLGKAPGVIVGVVDALHERGLVVRALDPDDHVETGRPLDSRTLPGAWRSLVARTVWVGEVPGSNPGAPMAGVTADGSSQVRHARPRSGANLNPARGVVGNPFDRIIGPNSPLSRLVRARAAVAGWFMWATISIALTTLADHSV